MDYTRCQMQNCDILHTVVIISTLTPKNFGKLGETFGGGGPGAPGSKILGVGPKRKTSSARGRPRVQNKIICGPLTQRTTAQWPPQEMKVLKISHERRTFGAPVAPPWGTGQTLLH